MGCDIHMYVEYIKTIKDNKQWVSGDYFKRNPYFKVFNGETEFEAMGLYEDRNYSLFSTLAGVRDYTNKVTPIAEPKGVPDDACDFVKNEAEKWDGDGHTHSWLSLKEIIEYQNSEPVMYYTGLISPSQLVEFDSAGKIPESWCQGTNQVGYERREWNEKNETLTPLIDKLRARAKELMQYEWQEYDIQNDEKIRIVFWFDN